MEQGRAETVSFDLICSVSSLLYVHVRVIDLQMN
jgi:hypothetical protein